MLAVILHLKVIVVATVEVIMLILDTVVEVVVLVQLEQMVFKTQDQVKDLVEMVL
jgi:hypothetical protein